MGKILFRVVLLLSVLVFLSGIFISGIPWVVLPCGAFMLFFLNGLLVRLIKNPEWFPAGRNLKGIIILMDFLILIKMILVILPK